MISSEYQQSDIIRIVNHFEFMNRTAIVIGKADCEGEYEVYLFGKPLNDDCHVLRLDQMRMYIKRESSA